MTRPQFGSSPAMAVFTKGELAIENEIFFASSSLLQFLTLIETNFDAPSPSAATLFAKFKSTLNRDFSKFLSFSSFTFVSHPLNYLANRYLYEMNLYQIACMK